MISFLYGVWFFFLVIYFIFFGYTHKDIPNLKPVKMLSHIFSSTFMTLNIIFVNTIFWNFLLYFRDFFFFSFCLLTELFLQGCFAVTHLCRSLLLFPDRIRAWRGVLDFLPPKVLLFVVLHLSLLWVPSGPAASFDMFIMSSLAPVSSLCVTHHLTQAHLQSAPQVPPPFSCFCPPALSPSVVLFSWCPS